MHKVLYLVIFAVLVKLYKVCSLNTNVALVSQYGCLNIEVNLSATSIAPKQRGASFDSFDQLATMVLNGEKYLAVHTSSDFSYRLIMSHRSPKVSVNCNIKMSVLSISGFSDDQLICSL